MKLIISDTLDTPGLYEWRLFDGPDGAWESRGLAPSIEQAVVDAERARIEIWENM